MNCETINLPKGADLSCEITIKDQFGAIINTALFTKLIIYVFHCSGTFISKYSMNPAPGYLTMDLTNGAAGKISFDLLTTHTNTAAEGKILYEVHGLFAEALLPDDGVLDMITTNNYLCTLIKSQTGAITLP